MGYSSAGPLLDWARSVKTGRRRLLIMHHALLSRRELADRAGLAMHLHLRKGISWVEDCKAEHGNGHHDTVQNDKVGFVPHDWICPALGHLANTEDATRKDSHERQGEADNEELPAKCRHKYDG